MQNRLSKTVSKLSKYPTWLRSWAIGRAVKFTGTAGISYEVMRPEQVIVSLANRPKVRNHIGQIHAAAMVLLAETASGMVVGMNIPDDKIPLIKSMEVQFVRRSQGAMRAEARLSPEQIEQILTQEKGEVEVWLQVQDESGEAPIQTKMIWAWIPKKKG